MPYGPRTRLIRGIQCILDYPNTKLGRWQSIIQSFFRGYKLMKFSFRWLLNVVDNLWLSWVSDTKVMPKTSFRGNGKGLKGSSSIIQIQFNSISVQFLYYSTLYIAFTLTCDYINKKSRYSATCNNHFLSVYPNGPSLNWIQPVGIIEDALHYIKKPSIYCVSILTSSSSTSLGRCIWLGTRYNSFSATTQIDRRQKNGLVTKQLSTANTRKCFRNKSKTN